MNRRFVLGGVLGSLAVAASAQLGPAVRGGDGLLRFANDAPIADFLAVVPVPVRLRSAEILVVDGEHQFVRVVSTDGVEGVIKANSRMEEVASLFHQVVVPAFMDRDLREMQDILADLFRAQYKFAGLAFWTAVGHLELAVWDLLGKSAQRRCVDLMGGAVRETIPIYVSSLDRNSSAENEVATLQEAVAETGARGAKIKVGGRRSRNEDAAPGRSEAVTKAVRRAFGDDFIIYADANGSYDAPAAIELCRMLKDHGVAMLEEPCPHEEVEMTRQVAQATNLMIAGGEQDGDMARWRWYLENRGLDLLQPDFMYNGGMLRTLMVQRMAAAAGVPIAPHYPRNGMEVVELLHFAAHAPNLYGLQEYRARPRVLDFAHSPVIAPKNGDLKLPPDPGFGVTVDPATWTNAVRI